MFNETYNSTNERNTRVITPDMLQEYRACMRTKEGTQKNVLSGLMGAAVSGLPLVFVKSEPVRRKALMFLFIGGLVGYQTSKYFQARACIIKTFNEFGIQAGDLESSLLAKEDTSDVNIYENGKNKLERPELAKRDTSPAITKESIFDVESPPQMSLLDEFPVINESADVLDNNEPERTVTYKELRQRNREAYKSRNVVQQPVMFREQSKEQPTQIKESETESKESDLLLEQSTGKRKTKYGDVWD